MKARENHLLASTILLTVACKILRTFAEPQGIIPPDIKLQSRKTAALQWRNLADTAFTK